MKKAPTTTRRTTARRKRVILNTGRPVYRGTERSRPSRSARKAAKDAVADRRPGAVHQPRQVGDVVQAHQAVGQDLARLEEVAQVRARESRAGCARALGVDRAELVPSGGVAQREASVRRQRAPVARQPGRHHAVEHVDAERDRGEELGVGPEPHEIAGAVGGELGHARLGHREHRVDGLPHREATDRHAVEVEPGDEARRLAPRAGIEPSLGDAEEQPAVARVRRPAALGPAMGALGCLSRRAGRGAMRDRVVEAHEHVGAEPRLVAHRVLRRHPQPRAVVGRDEGGAVVVDRRDLGEAHQLVAAAVGEDRVVPAHERVQPAGLLR